MRDSTIIEDFRGTNLAIAGGEGGSLAGRSV